MYIAFEGIDGSGKTTLIATLCDALRKLNYTPIRLQEPTYGRHGRRIREQMTEENDTGPEAQHELFTQDRREHVKHKINPALAFIEKHPGFVLVQDRCYLSAPAYQARSDEDVIRLLNEQQEFAPVPDFIFLLDLPVDVALERKKRSGSLRDLFEKTSILRDVRNRYLLLALTVAEGVEMLNAEQEPAELSRNVLNRIKMPPAL